MTRPLLCVVGMFKDEAGNVGDVLDSARPHVDSWCVTDTGSTDETRAIVVDRMHTLPGAIFDEPPRMAKLRSGKEVFDFAANRNRALDLAEGVGAGRPVFTIFLSGHERLHVEGDALRKFLEEHRDVPDGAYCVEMRTGTRSWPYTRVLRVDGGWRYDRKIHEVPIGPNGEFEGPTIPGVLIIHDPPADDEARKMRRIREHDLPTLEEDVFDESIPLEARAGSMFFLAETHALLAADAFKRDGEKKGGERISHQMAALGLYWRYAQLADQPDRSGFDPHKRDYALALYYSIAADVPGLYTHPEMVQRLEMLCALAPKMPEARFMLAKHAALAADPRIGPKVALFHAIEASKVAREALDKPTYQVMEETLVWRSLVLAADCAGALAEKATTMEERMKRNGQRRKLLEQAVKCGAPAELLKRLDRSRDAEQEKTANG